jgi:hypothetical protein
MTLEDLSDLKFELSEGFNSYSSIVGGLALCCGNVVM